MRAVLLLLILPGCVGPYLSSFDRALTRAEREVIEQCTDLDNPTNAARIDALALLSSSTNEIGDLRDRRKRYCEIFGAAE